MDSNIRKVNKLGETKSSLLLSCLEKNVYHRKDNKIRCNQKDSFLIKEIYQEIFQRTVNPAYIIILSLISSLLILKPKLEFIQNYLKIILFIFGFIIILFSQLSYKFISESFEVEILFITLPIIFIILFYLIILIKTNFKSRLL